MDRTKRGMSKGHTCRARRIKCDERQPTCGRCATSNLQCGGYARRHVFVSANPRVEGKHTGKKRHAACANQAESVSQTCKAVVATPKTTTIRDSLVGVPGQMPLQAFQEDIQSSFLMSRLFSGNKPQANWLAQHARTESSPTPKATMHALSTIYFGRIYRIESLVAQGIGLYISALRSLNNDLRDPTRATSLAVLRSADVLKFFELIAYNSRGGWMKHTGGIARLIELRGPHSFQEPQARLHLEENKSVIIIECLIARKHCFLANAKWESVPWQRDPASKSSIMRLYDIFAHVPGLVADADSLRHYMKGAGPVPCDAVTVRHELEMRICQCLASLYQWRAEWAWNNQDACSEVPAALAVEGEEPPFFSTMLQYRSLEVAREITTYDAVLLLLYRLGTEIVGKDFNSFASASACNLGPPPRASPLLFPGEAVGPQDVVVEICRSLQYYLIGEEKGVGAFYVLFPVNLAYHGVEKGSAIARWLEVVMARISDSKGFGIGRHLTNNGPAAVVTS